MRHSILITAVTVSVLAMPVLDKIARACPFCNPVSQTFSEEFDTMDVVVLAKVLKVPQKSDDNNATPKATFKIAEVIKGEKWVKPGQEIVQTYYGDGNKERTYLLSATDPPSLMWSSPLGLNAVSEKYVKELPSLPKGPERLEFFQEFLEHEDEMLARDAYDEFAKMPYDGVIALKDKMKHDRLIEWIKDTDVPATRRRLYFTMLGICGRPSDAKMLEDMMTSGDRKEKAGLDAMLACYLMLTGEKGLAKVDKYFLKNDKAEYADTYSAIMAIRFHGSEADAIKREKLVLSLRHILDRPNLADLVIPDLARWEDWEVMPRLVELFKNADEKSSWVRVPVINYLRACPHPEAESYIAELKEIDPDSVKRAMTFFPFGTDKKEEKSQENNEDKTDAAAFRGPPKLLEEAAFQQPLPPPEIDSKTTIAISSTIEPTSGQSQSASNEAKLTSLVEPSTEADPTAPNLSAAKADFTPVPSVDAESDGDPGKQVATAALPAVPATSGVASLPNSFLMVAVPILLCATTLYVMFRIILGLPAIGIPTNRT